MKSSAFEIIAKGVSVSIGERIVQLNDSMSVEDAQLVATQYPNGSYVKMLEIAADNLVITANPASDGKDEAVVVSPVITINPSPDGTNKKVKGLVSGS